MKKSIFEISEEYLKTIQELENYMVDNDTDEVPAHLDEALALNKDELDSKLKNYYFYIKEIEGKIQTIKDHVAQMNVKKKAYDKQIARLKSYVHTGLSLYGETNKSGNSTYKTDLFKVTASNTKRLKIVDETKIPEVYKREVYTIKIDSSGDDYTTRPPGKADEIPFYFCRIVGDGQDGVAMVYIFNGRIDKIRISDPGYGYTYAKLKFEANHVYDSLSDLYQNKNALNPQGNGGLRTTVIISPPGGWGYETREVGIDFPGYLENTTTIARQLGGTRVGVFSDMKGNEADFIEDTTFRQVGILQNSKGYIVDGAPRRTISVYNTVKVNRTTNGDSSQYIIGEMISQNTSHGQVVGVHQEGDDIYINYIQDPYLHCDPVTGNLTRFAGDDMISGDTSGVTSRPDITFSDFHSNQQFLDGYSLGEVMRYRGDFTYIDNLTATIRNKTQTERLSMIVEY